MSNAVVRRLRSSREIVRWTDIVAAATRVTRGWLGLVFRDLLVVIEHARHALGVVREIARQRIERGGELDPFLCREVVRRNAGAFQDGDVGNLAVAMDGEADRDDAFE